MAKELLRKWTAGTQLMFLQYILFRIMKFAFRIAVAPPFAGLRRFHEGRRFKQWTGDDSKALMKVFLSAIAGLVPEQMVRALSAFLEFCYLVRRSQIDEDVLIKIDAAIERYHIERKIFVDCGIRSDFNLPRQHALLHYRALIQKFGAPNGLCSSITESKHIKAVKQPWRRSSRNEPLGQMLLINQRLDKLAAFRVDLSSRDMLNSVNGNPTRSSIARRAPSPTPPGNAAQADAEPVDGLTCEGDVSLPGRPGFFFLVFLLGYLANHTMS